MQHILAMALRNVGRNKRRSFLAALSVSLSITLIVFMQGFIGGYMGSLVRNYTRSESGHIRITTAAYADKSKFMPVTENIADPQDLLNSLKNSKAADQIELVAPRFSFGVLLTNEGNNKTAIAIAGDPQKEKELTMLHKGIQPGGRYLSGARELIMGKDLSQALGYSVGDTVKVMTQGADYSLNLRKFALVGIFQTNINTLDRNVFQIGLEDAQALLRSENGVQQIFVFLKDYRKADAAAAQIRESVNDTTLAVIPWTKIGNYYQLVKMMEGIYGWIYGIVAMLGAFIITSIMMMVVLERRKEIGILKSMGFKRREILLLFLCEGTVMGVIGTAAGLILGIGITAVTGFIGIDFSRMLQTMTMPIDNIIYPRLTIAAVLQVTVIGIAVSALVSLLPSRQAAKMNVVDAIKSV